MTPALTIDFTSAVLDPRIGFTRALGTATRFNSTGLVEAVAADTPRFDFNPITLACRGLLVEESKANIVTYSEAFNVNTAGAWSGNSGIVIASNTADTTAPDGSNNADRLTAASANGFIFNPTTLTAAVVYSYSVFVKAGTASRARVNVFDTGDHYAVFNLTGAGSVGNVVGITSSQVSALPNGWYRCAITFTSGGSASAQVRVLLPDAGTIYAWGAQVEVGQLTSYISNPATGTTTRNADVATITGTNFNDWWQASKGGVLVRARPGTVSGVRPWLQFDDGTANEIIALRGNTTNPELYIVDGGTPQAQIDAGTIAANTDYSLTGWWATNDCKARLDSGAVVTDTSATIPTVTQARLGSDGTNYLNGHLASISYYDSFSEQIYTRRKNKAVFNLM